MKFVILFFAWCLLLVLCWPVALLAVILLPVIWLVLLPFRIAMVVVKAVLALVEALFMLPARVVGWRPAATPHASRS